MKVFMTGATGYVGSAIVPELLNSGHQILGLARSAEAAKKLEAAGVEVHSGSLEDIDSLSKGAAKADGVIHTGFIHEFHRFKEVCELDRQVISTLGTALGSGKPMVVTSAIGAFSPGHTMFEKDNPTAATPVTPRFASEEAAHELLEQGVNVMVIRLPASVHGQGDPQFVRQLAAIAQEKGVSAYIGQGNNRWPAVHREDAAHLFCLALEKGKAGAKYHSVAEEGIALRKLAEVIGKALDIPVRSLEPAEAEKHFGHFSFFVSKDMPANSEATRKLLGWKPSHPTLLEDLAAGYYFTR